MSNAKAHFISQRDAVMVVCIAAIFVLAIAYSVFSSVSAGDNLSVTGTASVSTHIYASSSVQATGDSIFYDQLSVVTDSTGSPTTTFNVSGSGYFTAGLGVGFATTGTGDLHITGMGMFEKRVGVNGTTSPVVEFGVTGSGDFSNGLGVGYATTSGLKVASLGVFNNRLGVNSTTSPYQEFGLTGDAAQASAATTTLSLESTSATQGGCIELKSSTENRWVRIYVSSGAGTSSNAFMMGTSNLKTGGTPLLIVELGRCQ